MTRMTGPECTVMCSLICIRTQRPAPQRDRRIILRPRAQGREARNRIGQGGGDAKKSKQLHKSGRRHVENGGDLGGNRGKRRHESVDSIAADPDNLEKRIARTQGWKHKALRV